MHKPQIMGIVNVTPDSFSDGGRYAGTQAAIDHARRLIDEGADIVDIGGESTRPGAMPVSPEEEMARVLPVIEGLRDCGAEISIDTYHAATMTAAVAAGATMINDIYALRGEGSLAAAAAAQARVCLMHMQGTPVTMQNNPVYGDVVAEVLDFLGARIAACEAVGIARERLIVDPGIGFGKTLAHNLMLLRRLNRFAALGVPVMVGVSRKGFIAALTGNADLGDRLPGSLATALWARQQGATLFRVHDVAATRQALAVRDGIASG